MELTPVGSICFNNQRSRQVNAPLYNREMGFLNSEAAGGDMRTGMVNVEESPTVAGAPFEENKRACLDGDTISGYSKFLNHCSEMMLFEGGGREPPSSNNSQKKVAALSFTSYTPMETAAQKTIERKLRSVFGDKGMVTVNSYSNYKCACHRLLFPLHVNGNHWVLLAFNLRTRQVELYDSLSGRDGKKHYAHALKMALKLALEIDKIFSGQQQQSQQ